MSNRPMKAEFVKKCDHICMMEEGHAGIHQYGYEHPSPRERDRDHWDAREELDKLRAPVEPPVLSREFLDSLIEQTTNRLDPSPNDAATVNTALQNFARAILESLSQEDGQ